jgi:hypothetical protein
MLSDDMLTFLSSRLPFVSLIATNNAGSQPVRVAWTNSGSVLTNYLELAFDIPANTRVFGYRFHDLDGNVTDETLFDEPLPYPRQGRHLVPPGALVYALSRVA